MTVREAILLIINALAPFYSRLQYSLVSGTLSSDDIQEDFVEDKLTCLLCM